MTETEKEKDIVPEGMTVSKTAEQDTGPDGWKGGGEASPYCWKYISSI